MELSRKACRLCLSETEFNVSLFSNFSRRANLLEKILVCLKLAIEDGDSLSAICYRCTENVERYYDFIMTVKASQKLVRPQHKIENTRGSVQHHMVSSYVREQIYDADYTFSFLEMPEEEKPQKAQKASSPFFSYFSPPNLVNKDKERIWKTPKPRESAERKHDEGRKRPFKDRHNSRDLFESQSQDDARPDWSLTPDNSIIKRIRNKCFGASDF